MHKLSPPWEGPFVVSKNLNNGSYYLIDVREHKDSRKLEEETQRPWNIALLRLYADQKGYDSYVLFGSNTTYV